MFTFYIENHEPFGSLTKNCPKLDKNKSIVSGFPVFARGEGLANIYSFEAEISSKICKNCLEHVKHVEKSYWKTDRTI